MTVKYICFKYEREVLGIYNRIGFCTPFFILTVISMFLFDYYGECNFMPMRKTSGKYGVGCRRFWVNGKYNHVIAYYPCDTGMMEDGYAEPDEYFLPYNLFGEEASI